MIVCQRRQVDFAYWMDVSAREGKWTLLTGCVCRPGKAIGLCLLDVFNKFDIFQFVINFNINCVYCALVEGLKL